MITGLAVVTNTGPEEGVSEWSGDAFMYYKGLYNMHEYPKLIFDRSHWF